MFNEASRHRRKTCTSVVSALLSLTLLSNFSAALPYIQATPNSRPEAGSFFSRQAFVEPYLLGALRPLHPLAGAYLRRLSREQDLLMLPGFFSAQGGLKWLVIAAA